MSRHFHPGQAILDNLGITAKNIVSFSLECQGNDHMPTITLNQVILGTPEPTYRLQLIHVIDAEPIGFDLDALIQGAQAAVANTITTTYRKARQLVYRDFLCARERLNVPVREQHLLQADARWEDWLCVNCLAEAEPFYIRRAAA